MQQEHTICEFSGSDSWVILSPIEQSIRRKIESIGTPLKDWDINIYRGVLTGYNDAFIISTEKREEILANCQTEDERQKTAELIRPLFYLCRPKTQPVQGMESRVWRILSACERPGFSNIQQSDR